MKLLACILGLYCMGEKVYFQILGLHSALRDAHTLEGFREQQVLFSWLICTLTCTPATAYAHGMREQWVPLTVVNSPFHSLPLTSLLSPLSSSLFPSPSLYPYPFLLSLLCRKCKIECLHKDYVMHFIVLPGNVPCQANITMQLT